MPRPTKEGLYQKADRPHWYCRFYLPDGTLIRQSTGETDHAAALRVYNQQRITANCKPDNSQPLTVADVLTVYHTKRGYQLKGKGYRDGRKQLLSYFDGVPWAELAEKGEKVRNIRNYTANRLQTVKPSSVNREIGILSAAANVAIAEGYDIRNYAEGQRQPVASTQYYWLTPEQASNLIDAAKPRTGYRHSNNLHDYCVIALGTGMRMSEILKLTRRDISLRHNVIRLPTSKSAEPHEIPMTETVRAAIESRIAYATKLQTPHLFANPSKLTPIKSIITPFKAACRRAGQGYPSPTANSAR